MFTPFSDQSRTIVERPQADAALADSPSPLVRLLAEMQAEWRAGGAPHVESIFQRHPELRESPEAALRLIYEEICQRRALGDDVLLGELYNRFPQWYTQLQGLVERERPLATSTSGEIGGFDPSFEVIAELGRGSGGRVYLARQKALGNRLVVLKVTSTEGMEHLSLARLQHTNIAPLYGVLEDPVGLRRALCMPYFGSTTLFNVFESLKNIPREKRRGTDIIAVLERREREIAGVALGEKHAAPIWASEDCVVALCSIAAALAQALADAHGRGLLHLDLKPSNVLLTVDGQAMLLDFHLARAPLNAGDPPPEMFGGSPPFMSPEQNMACNDVSLQRSVSVAVDARADLYSLGMLIYVGLADEPPPEQGDAHAFLRSRNRQVSVGLADIVVRCLAADPANRYQNANHLAEDLRRHIHAEPLAHVPNRSVRERWFKWRRRRPLALPVLILAAVLLAVMAASVVSYQRTVAGQRQSAETMFVQGQVHLQARRYAQAVEAFAHAHDNLPALSDSDPLKRSISRGLAIARRAQHAKDASDIVDALRLAIHSEPIDYRTLIVLEVNSKDQWSKRSLLLDDASVPHDARLDATIRRELTELALNWADVHVRLAPPGREQDYRTAASKILEEARAISPSPRVIDWWLAPRLDDAIESANAWEWYCLGQTYLRRGETKLAFDALEQAVFQEPADFWSNFVLGVAAMKLGRSESAIAAFSVCVGQRPLQDTLYVRRGQAYAALKQWDHALHDFDRALQIRPNVRDIFIARGRAHLETGRFGSAADDFRQALEQGAPVEDIQPLLDRIPKN